MKGLQARGAAAEFEDVDLGDSRLDQRVQLIARRLEAKPDASFPDSMKTEGDLEGFYRLLRNPRVGFEELLAPHVAATLKRIKKLGSALVVHDSSELRYGGFRDGLGPLKKVGEGYVAHLSLAVPRDEDGAPLGVLAVEAWARTSPAKTSLIRAGVLTHKEARELPSEQNRWFAGVVIAESELHAHASITHVMDSEADDYQLLDDMDGVGCTFIVRLKRGERRLSPAVPDARNVREFVATRPVMCERDVKLSRRRKAFPNRRRSAARTQRDARLSIRTGTTSLRNPGYLPHASRDLSVNIVSVAEENPPAGCEPVEWLLVTNESIETEGDVLRVIDAYRARWKIEEFFKALKTGCAIEKRQLESSATLFKALALLIPVAWSLLRLRTVARSSKNDRADTVLSAEQLTVLRRASQRPLPPEPSARDALLAIAQLGGHQKSNGEPGWQLLGRGYQDLLMMVAGYRLATEPPAEM